MASSPDAICITVNSSRSSGNAAQGIHTVVIEAIHSGGGLGVRLSKPSSNNFPFSLGPQNEGKTAKHPLIAVGIGKCPEVQQTKAASPLLGG